MTFTTIVLPLLLGFLVGVLVIRAFDYFANEADYLDDDQGAYDEGAQ